MGKLGWLHIVLEQIYPLPCECADLMGCVCAVNDESKSLVVNIKGVKIVFFMIRA